MQTKTKARQNCHLQTTVNQQVTLLPSTSLNAPFHHLILTCNFGRRRFIALLGKFNYLYSPQMPTMIIFSQHLGGRAEQMDSISPFSLRKLLLCVVKTFPNSYLRLLFKLWQEREILTLWLQFMPQILRIISHLTVMTNAYEVMGVKPKVIVMIIL